MRRIKQFSIPDVWNVLISRGTGIGMVAILLMLGLRANLFFALPNLMDVLKQGSILTLIALGLTAVLIGGGFDMGAGALVQLTCNLSAGVIIAGINPALTLPLGLVVGLLFGGFNAFLVTIVKIPSFVATLGTMFVLQGLTTFYNQGEALTIKSQPFFSFLGQGSISLIPMIFIIVIIINFRNGFSDEKLNFFTDWNFYRFCIEKFVQEKFDVWQGSGLGRRYTFCIESVSNFVYAVSKSQGISIFSLCP